MINIPSKYIECWYNWEFDVAVALFLLVCLIATFFEWKYLTEKRKNKLIFYDINNSPDSTKSKKCNRNHQDKGGDIISDA